MVIMLSILSVRKRKKGRRERRVQEVAHADNQQLVRRPGCCCVHAPAGPAAAHVTADGTRHQLALAIVLATGLLEGARFVSSRQGSVRPEAGLEDGPEGDKGAPDGSENNEEDTGPGVIARRRGHPGVRIEGRVGGGKNVIAMSLMDIIEVSEVAVAEAMAAEAVEVISISMSIMMMSLRCR